MEGAITGYVVQKLGDFLLQEISLLRKTEEDLEWIKSELGMLEAFMEYAIPKEILDPRVKTWVKDVQDLAFHAEDILDSFATDTRRYIGIGSCGLFIRSTSPSLSVRHKFGKEVGFLKERVNDLTRRKKTYGIEPSLMEPQNREDRRRLSQIRRMMAKCPGQDKDVVVGLELQMEDEMKRLQGDELQRLVLSIVGMGGIGKTTLAKKVYRKMKEGSTFRCTAWVVVSQEYDYLQLLNIIAEQVMDIPSKDLREMGTDKLEEKLRQFLCDKRYLIVLDDVWETYVSEYFCGIFPDSGNRSRMIITTRSMNVGISANHGSILRYELPFLDEKAAWELFAKKVFPCEQNPEECLRNDELKGLAKEMVEKCNGLPLAIVILGGLLSSMEKSHHAWSKINNGTQWKEPRMEDRCMRILALSYRALSVHMRCCFLYLGIFPEDVINVQNLSRLWIAEGFIIKIDGEDLEETAERYVEELIQRCLVQVVKRNSYGSIVEIRVHDLMLELATREAKCGRFMEIWRNEEDVSLARRLVVAKPFPKHFSFHRKLRSLFLRKEVVTHSLDFKNFNSLRVLDVCLARFIR